MILTISRGTGSPKGFGYVAFSSVQDAQKAYQAMNGTVIAGRTVRLDYAAPRTAEPIPTPYREVTKGEDGSFVCTWAGCTEEVRSFNNKSEWSEVSFSLSSKL
jgi:RNA recognition motif-containing protein